MNETVALAGFSEPLSSWLHIGGAVLAALSARALWKTGSSRRMQLSLAVFAFGAVFALAMSGVYHALTPGADARAVLQRLDHAAIWVLIASTFTPVHAIMFRGVRRWGMLVFIWACAATGIVLKTVFFDTLPETLGLALYLALGWMGMVSAAMLWRSYGGRVVRMMLLGGALYTIGAVASVVGTPTPLPGYVGHHELFHLAVLAALYVHWRFVGELTALSSAGSRRPVRSSAVTPAGGARPAAARRAAPRRAPDGSIRRARGR